MGGVLKYVRFRFCTKYLKTEKSEAVNFLEELPSEVIYEVLFDGNYKPRIGIKK